jgi:CRISPR-associated protein Cas2
MFVVIAYDIADAKRLYRVAKIMEDYGIRVQYSVFEVYADKQTLRTLISRALAEMDTEKDSVRLYPLCKDCEGSFEILGDPVYTFDQADVVVYKPPSFPDR